jgi:hypothetical protein
MIRVQDLGDTVIYDLLCPMCERNLFVVYIEKKKVFSFYCEPCGIATPRVLTQFGLVTITIDESRTNLHKRAN